MSVVLGSYSMRAPAFVAFMIQRKKMGEVEDVYFFCYVMVKTLMGLAAYLPLVGLNQTAIRS